MLTAFQDERENTEDRTALKLAGHLSGKTKTLLSLKSEIGCNFKRYYDTGRVFSYKDTRWTLKATSASLTWVKWPLMLKSWKFYGPLSEK